MCVFVRGNTSSFASMLAAGRGDLHALRQMHARGFTITGSCLGAAAWAGAVPVLEWLRGPDVNCFWDEVACQNAALEGHLDALKWLRGQQPPCPWNVSVCFRLAEESGHTDTAAWIKDCPKSTMRGVPPKRGAV
jgi:hypothetical protein